MVMRLASMSKESGPEQRGQSSATGISAANICATLRTSCVR